MAVFRVGDAVASMGFAWKTADQTQTANITLTDDTVLTLPVQARTSYLVEMDLLVNNAAATAQFKFQFTVPASSGFNGLVVNNVLTATAFSSAVQRTDAAPALTTAIVTGAIDGVVKVSGILLTAAAAGTLTLQWAQAVSDAGVTMVARGSWLRLTKIG